jgi:hypothetical protein
MLLPSWFRPRLIGSFRLRAPRRRRAPWVPTLERLEDRSLPSLFGPATPFHTGPAPESVAVGDFGNGHLDLAVANLVNVNGSGSVSVLLGNGDGTFQAQRTYPVGMTPTSVAVGDFGNGHLDLAVANSTSDSVSVLLGNGDGTF